MAPSLDGVRGKTHIRIALATLTALTVVGAISAYGYEVAVSGSVPTVPSSSEPLPHPVISPEAHRHAKPPQRPEPLKARRVSPEREALQEDLLEWALGRFENAGLELPPFDIAFLDNAACDGWVGLVEPDEDTMVVKICAGGSQLRHNLLHELAHVWDLGGGITETARREFLMMRGLDSWRNANVDWNRRGQEHAAEIIAWGLEVAQWDLPTTVSEVGPQDVSSLRSAYLLLTGRTPLWETDHVASAPYSTPRQRQAS